MSDNRFAFPAHSHAMEAIRRQRLVKGAHVFGATRPPEKPPHILFAALMSLDESAQ